MRDSDLHEEALLCATENCNQPPRENSNVCRDCEKKFFKGFPEGDPTEPEWMEKAKTLFICGNVYDDYLDLEDED